MARKRKGPARIRIATISVRHQNPDWGFMKELRCVRFTGFENGSTLITGTIPSKGKNKSHAHKEDPS
jgi:hypothetical protein